MLKVVKLSNHPKHLFLFLEMCHIKTHVQISRNLFRWTKEIAYADYYERALINGVLSIQRGTDPGVMIYMLPQAPGHSKAVSYHGWGTKYDSFWCCYGTGNIKTADIYICCLHVNTPQQ
jgi:uncharacterized protein